ncbi:MAG: hypothetical protein ACRCYY_08805 [Trueperaceae bacterium]
MSVKNASIRASQWQRFAEELELYPSEGSLGMVRQLINEPVAAIAPIYRREVETLKGTKVELFFFDYEQTHIRPMGYVEQLISVSMLVVPQRLSALSLKANRKAHKILEAISASATGGLVVNFADADFNEAVTVYARDDAEAKRFFHKGARTILQRALWERKISPTFLLGETVLLFSHTAVATKPTQLEELAGLATDLLSLYAVLHKD